MSTPVTEVTGKPATKKSSLAAFVVKTERTRTEAPVRKVVEGKRKNLSLRLTRDQWLRISRLALDMDASVQELALQGLSRLFTDRGLPPLE